MNFNGLNVLLADQQTAQPDPNALIKLVGMMAIFFVIVWVLMISPQRKQAKKQELMLKALRAGDKIVTASGIIGVVLSIKDRSVSIRSADTKLEILKSAVADVTEHGGE
jgi:preprotein translocase subunit YajC